MTSSSLLPAFGAALLSATLLSACASNDRDRRGPPRGNGASVSDGAKVARADALVLTAMASGADGQLRIAAIDSGAATLFSRYDADRSGQISPTEYAQFAQVELGDPYGRPSLMTMDRSGDSAVSKSEFIDGWRAVAERYDTDGDGVIRRTELLRSLPQRAGGRGAGQTQSAQGGRGEGGRGGGGRGGRG